jgi:hypothetical protein
LPARVQRASAIRRIVVVVAAGSYHLLSSISCKGSPR